MIKNVCMFFLFLLFTVSSAAAASLTTIAAGLAVKAGNSSVVKGEDGWLFLTEELVHIGSGEFWGGNAAAVSRSSKKQFADPLPAILAYNKLLAERGITLYFMPVPPKALIYPDKLAAGLDRDSSAEQVGMYEKFYSLLRQGGVDVVDLLPVLLAKRDERELYCRTDTHFSAAGIDLFAEAAATAIKGAEWYGETAKKEYAESVRTVVIHGDLAQMADLKDMSESIKLSFVTVKESGQQEVSDPASPVILLGDSHTLVFSVGGDLHARGGGLFDHLSMDLGFPVDLLGVRGSGVTPARIRLYQRAKKDSAYLQGKKAVIWCFTARDFTGSGGWQKIPVAP